MPTIYLGNLLGATGPNGPSGLSGPSGPAGPQGDPGGATGATGPSGNEGTEGVAGPAGPGYMGTSTDTIDLYITSVGQTVSIQTQDGLAYNAGQMIRMYSNDGSVPGDMNFLVGHITSYSGTVLSFAVDYKSGTSTSSDWVINLDGEIGPTGPSGPAGSSGSAGPEGSTGATGPRGLRGLGIPATNLNGATAYLDCTYDDAFSCELNDDTTVRLNNMSIGQTVYVKVKVLNDTKTLTWDSPNGDGTQVINWQPGIGNHEVSFFAHKNNVAQSVPNHDTDYTKVTFSLTDNNIGDAFDLATNRFVPPFPGRYVLSASLSMDDMAYPEQYRLAIRRNGTDLISQQNTVTYAGNSDPTLDLHTIVDTDTGEYYELVVFQDDPAGARNAKGDKDRTFFAGFLVGTYSQDILPGLNESRIFNFLRWSSLDYDAKQW